MACLGLAFSRSLTRCIERRIWKMMEFKRHPIAPLSPIVLMITAFLFLAVGGCASSGKPPVEAKCPADIEWQVAPEAQITQFECAMGTQNKEVALIFKVGIKNVTDKPLRYILNILLEDMHKGAGSLVPVKGKPPVVEPGKVETVTVPFIKTAELSKKVMVAVESMQD
jgi:hypothetical protein